MEKSTEEKLNYELYKEDAKERGKALRNMARTIIRNIPREMLIDILKKMNIIKRDWIKDGEVHVEVQKGNKTKEKGNG